MLVLGGWFWDGEDKSSSVADAANVPDGLGTANVKGKVGPSAGDLEPGPQSLSTHTETEIAQNGNGNGRAS